MIVYSSNFSIFISEQNYFLFVLLGRAPRPARGPLLLCTHWSHVVKTARLHAKEFCYCNNFTESLVSACMPVKH